MSVKFSNNGHSKLASSLTTSATTITLASGHGARFPSLTGSEYFYATLIDSSNNLEIVKVTARSSDVLTVTRAQESTTARAYAVGDRVELRVTAQGLVDVGTPTADSIINSMIADDAVDTPQIADDAITAALIDDNAVGAAALNVSGNGTSGQYLESDGDGTFSWSTVSTAVLKVESYVSTSRNTTTGSGFNTKMSGTYNKQSASSKVIVMVVYRQFSESAGAGVARFSLGASNEYTGTSYGNTASHSKQVSANFYFSGNTQTGSLTWQFDIEHPGGTVFNPSSSDDSRINNSSNSVVTIMEYV